MSGSVLVIGTMDTNYDPEGNRTFGEELKRCLKPEIEVEEVDAHINEPLYAETAVALLEGMMEGGDAPIKSGQCSAS